MKKMQNLQTSNQNKWHLETFSAKNEIELKWRNLHQLNKIKTMTALCVVLKLERGSQARACFALPSQDEPRMHSAGLTAK